MTLSFPNIEKNWKAITERSVECLDYTDDISSLKGRGISLLHTLAIPLKTYSGLGRLATDVLSIASIVIGVATLNQRPEALKQAGAYVLDFVAGGILLPIALVAQSIRGVVGTIFHPGAMIRQFDRTKGDLPTWGVEHNLLKGTLVNYSVYVSFTNIDISPRFSAIKNHWEMLTQRTVAGLNDEDDIASLKGRGISFLQTVATPLKAYTGLGRVALDVIEFASIVLGVITLNRHPIMLKQAGADVVDVVGGSVLLPFGLAAHAIRGVIGMIIHPGIMIRREDIYSWAAKHNILQGTLVNY